MPQYTFTVSIDIGASSLKEAYKALSVRLDADNRIRCWKGLEQAYGPDGREIDFGVMLAIINDELESEIG